MKLSHLSFSIVMYLNQKYFSLDPGFSRVKIKLIDAREFSANCYLIEMEDDYIEFP